MLVLVLVVCGNTSWAGLVHCDGNSQRHFYPRGKAGRAVHAM